MGCVTGSVVIREAVATDVPALLSLIQELAEYEKEPDAVEADEAMLRAAFFGPDPRVHATVAELDGVVIAAAIWFVNFSTWRGRHGIHLEDLVVTRSARGDGHGRALLAHLAAICVERGYRRLDWFVLDWNAPAAGFYRAMGARHLADWQLWRLDGQALAEFASATT